jgi:hypothetical protein
MPHDVTDSFQVSLYMAEPSFCVRFFSRSASLRFKAFPSSLGEEFSGNFSPTDLLAEDMGRSAGGNEPQEFGPQVPVVCDTFTEPCGTEWLTRARSTPHWHAFRPSSLLKRNGPTPDPCKKVALPEPFKIIR